MAQMGRPGLSLAQKKELWRRWKEGESLSEIGRALGKHAGSIHGVVKANGGIVPTTRMSPSRSSALSASVTDSRLVPMMSASSRWLRSGRIRSAAGSPDDRRSRSRKVSTR